MHVHAVIATICCLAECCIADSRVAKATVCGAIGIALHVPNNFYCALGSHTQCVGARGGANAPQENLIHMYSTGTCIQLLTYRYIEQVLARQLFLNP